MHMDISVSRFMLLWRFILLYSGEWCWVVWLVITDVLEKISFLPSQRKIQIISLQRCGSFPSSACPDVFWETTNLTPSYYFWLFIRSQRG